MCGNTLSDFAMNALYVLFTVMCNEVAKSQKQITARDNK